MENLYKAVPRLGECCRQVEAEEVSNSRKKIHQTWDRPYRYSLYAMFIAIILTLFSLSLHFQFQDFRFLCPNDTVFDQQNLVCTNWFEVDCQQSVALFLSDFGHKKLTTQGCCLPLQT